MLAISLDIKNAINTLLWDRMGDSLKERGVPQYLVGIIRDYFRDRSLEYVGRDGGRHTRSIRCGDPQESVLGSLLWDLTYDRMLCLPLPRGCHAICYVDDTLVVAAGDNWGDAAARAEIAVARMVGEITDMGPQVAVQKTEAMYFHGKASGTPPPTHISIGGTSILVGDRLNISVSYWTVDVWVSFRYPRPQGGEDRGSISPTPPKSWGSGWSDAPSLCSHNKFCGFVRRTRVGGRSGGQAASQRHASPHAEASGRQSGKGL